MRYFAMLSSPGLVWRWTQMKFLFAIEVATDKIAFLLNFPTERYFQYLIHMPVFAILLYT